MTSTRKPQRIESFSHIFLENLVLAPALVLVLALFLVLFLVLILALVLALAGALIISIVEYYSEDNLRRTRR